MENEVLKLILSVEDKSVIKATQEAKRLEKEIKALVATEKVLGKEHDVVKQKTIEIKRKLQDYANISSQKAVPTLKKLIQTERSLSREVDKNTAALTRNTKATKLAADATNQYGVYATGAGKKLNTMNMRIQQGGYQLQDFFVQMQSGTSFFTAFAQQGSQFAGVFGPTGAVLGAVIAIGSAIAAIAYNSYNASKDMRDLSDVMDDLSDVSSDLLDSFTEIDEVLDSTADNMGLVSDAYKTFLDLKLQDNLLEQTRQFRSLGSSISDSAGELSTFQRLMLGLSKGPQGMGILAPLMDPFGTQRGISERFEKGLSGQNVQETLGVSSEVLGKRLSEYDRALLSGDFESAQRVLVDLYDDVFANVSKTNDVFNSTKTAIESTIDLLQKRLDIEKDTTQVTKDAEEAKKQAAEDDKNRIKDLAAAELKLWKENNEYTEEQKRLDAEGDLAILNSRAQAERDLISANSKYEREQDALRKKELDETNKKVTELAERLSIPFSAALSLIRQAKAEATVGLDAFGGVGDFKYNVPTKFSPPKKVKGAKAPKDPLQQLMKRLTLEERLLGVEEDRAAVMQALGESYSKYTPEQINSAIELTEYIRKQNEALKAQQDELDRIDDQAKQLAAPFEDFFMTLADGTTSTKEAFRAMASDIIQQLYRILVVEKMVKSISGVIGNYLGQPSNATAMANQEASFEYDGGGYTGSGPRSGGLDGKGGFMAMLHPRETVIDHTKGQSTGGTVVNQTFNISANTSDDTKRLITQTIAQASPAIINQSVGAVMNQRRRGGAMKSAFG